MDIFQIISGVLGVIIALLGTHLAKIKKIVKEAEDLILIINAAADDNKITRDELKTIVKEAKEFFAALKALLK